MTDDDLKRLWREVDEALAPSNARKFDGDNNFKKCLDLKITVVGDDTTGAPVFVLDMKSLRSVVNNLGMTQFWNTNSRTEAAAVLRALANKIEEGT